MLYCCYSSFAWTWILLSCSLTFLFGTSIGESSYSSVDSEALFHFKLSGIGSLEIKSLKSTGGRSQKYKWCSSHFECPGTYIRGWPRSCAFQFANSWVTFRPIGNSWPLHSQYNGIHNNLPNSIIFFSAKPLSYGRVIDIMWSV